MKIKEFEVIGLQGRDSIKLVFNTDMNIITGKNGSGKTSILKLLWYVLSGNILIALKELEFKKVTLITDQYECTIHRIDRLRCRIEWKQANETLSFEDLMDDDGDIFHNAEDDANDRLREIGSSVFLPTFRRIEGGFTIGEDRFVRTKNNDIEESLGSLSKKLSKGAHTFVVSLSTVDIVTMLVKQYTDISEVSNKMQQTTSSELIDTIRNFKQSQSNNSDALNVIDTVYSRIQELEENRSKIMKPLEAVVDLAMKLFKHDGIKLGRTLSFGDAAGAINSDLLSAGEKQMLSFIAYNAFYKDSVFIIDEPELSLHVDWQRQLFPTLQSQNSTNQFIIATHSPFIYSKYPDKEIQIDPNRGDEEN